MNTTGEIVLNRRLCSLDVMRGLNMALQVAVGCLLYESLLQLDTEKDI